MVRSRCQTFSFARPRLPELVTVLRRDCEGEGIEAPDAALALIARSARGSFRDAESTLDQLAAATEKQVTVQAVLQLLGAVEEEALFRLCDLVVDRDTAGALTFIEELSEQGQDLGRLVTDLLEHLRHLLLVQHMGEVPESLPVTEETRDRLREQANQLPEPTGLRLCDLLAVAVEDQSLPPASVLRAAHPKDLAGDTLTVEFPRAASFHRQLAEDPKNATLLAEALYEVTGRRLALAFEVGENGGDAEPPPDDEPASEEEIIELMKGTFDAREVSEE